ncbi:MAG: hypothetical protein H7Y11_13470, partial [Armatimonadetes bacterium]|nr:hypothetical protein [Anaerolineae bacterium]
MNARFRLLIIGLGALLVIATYSFPLWSPLLQAGEVFPFPELDPILYPAFDALPVDRQSDYLQLRRGALTLALDMATSALQPDVVVPAEQQIQPELSGQQPIRSGTWIALTPNRTAAGLATVYELPDGSRYLWLSEFSAIQAPDLRLYLSRQASAMLEELE